MTAALTIVAYILGVALFFVLFWALIVWAVMRNADRKLDVDRYEDREQSDRDVQQIKDSMRGVL
jgi:hypothetical protein